MNGQPSALELWRERLESFLAEEAIASDPATKFQLKVQIREARQKIAELKFLKKSGRFPDDLQSEDSHPESPESSDKYPPPPPTDGPKALDLIEGSLTVDTISWRTSVLLTPAFQKAPEITIIHSTGRATVDPKIESVTSDKFTVKISSSDQAGVWSWRARGRFLDTKSVDRRSMTVTEITEGRLTLDTISWRASDFLTPPFLEAPKITLVHSSGRAAADPKIELVTRDKFTAKISSSDQTGEWVWRARGLRAYKTRLETAEHASVEKSSNEPSTEVSSPLRENIVETKTPAKKTLRVVAIMHGIRDEGRWMTPLKRLIENETGAEVAALSPDRVSLTWFLLGGRYLGYVKRYRGDVAKLLSNYHEAEIIFIAHSYGTWCLADVLENWGYRRGVMPVGIILCDSILRRNYPWGDRWRQVFQRGREQGELTWVWNDVGGRDPFPLLARLVTKAYGVAGVSSFTEPTPGLVINRIHAGLDHGGCFVKKDDKGLTVLNEAFARKFWLPIVRGTAPAIRRLSYWVKTGREVGLWFAGLQIFGWCMITFGNSQWVQTPGRILVVLGATIPILWLWNGIRENPSSKKTPFTHLLAALFFILFLLAGIAWVVAALFRTVSPRPNIAVSTTPSPRQNPAAQGIPTAKSTSAEQATSPINTLMTFVVKADEGC